ncbi:MAG: UDP-N-acetylmuramoyl-L-alanyl-D-glutamate--2,6-diaminopimelate ligase [Planctomycetota bacterium]
MLLHDLIADTDCRVVSAIPSSVRITDISEDSRACTPGCMFVARVGTAHDAVRFVPDAITNGARVVLIDASSRAPDVPEGVALITSADTARTGAIIAERFFGSPSYGLFTAGVTGTNGKTTVTALAHAMLNHAGVRAGLIGTVSIDDGHNTHPATLTTPPATTISRTLAAMHENGCSGAMLECSSHALHQSRTAAIDFDTAVFTNLSGDHLDYHGDIDAYARAKSTLFAQLGDGLAIVNTDAPHARTMLDACPDAEKLSFVPAGSTSRADAHVRIIESTLASQRLEVVGPWGTADAILNAPGAHNATNALAAACIAWRAGLDADRIASALPHARMPAGRLQRVEGPDSAPTVLIDFAHTDDALATTLAALRADMTDDQRLVCLFGCGGDRDRTKRPRMGRAACTHAHRVVLTSDNPRTEPPHAIIDDVLAGLDDEQRARTEVHPDRAHAIRVAIGNASPSDVVVIAGKGHEREQILPDGAGGTLRTPFDDAQHARAALEAWGDR